MKKSLTFSILFHFWLSSFCQDLVFRQKNSIPVSDAKGSISNAWTGGINACNFSKFDFDLDGVEDLLVFDRQQNRTQVYLVKQNKYEYSPALSALLPPTKGYILFYDYNKDNKKDLFTSGTLGITVYKNVSSSSQVKFQLLMDPILTRYYSDTPINMSITYLDIPALTDIDKDGDMDILHFYSQTGENALLETNFSMEKYGRPDSLYFGTANTCWGGFSEVSCTNYLFGNNCKVNYNYRIEHVGAGALTVFDADGNGYPDLLVGKSDCQNLNYLQNNASGTTSIFTKRISYPGNAPSDLYFPISTIEDFDFDGVKDLVISMGLTETMQNTDLQKTAWLYKNIGSNTVSNFQLNSKNFVQNTMIDLDKNSVPAFADEDGDGDLDLFVASSSNMVSRPSTIAYFKNIGSQNVPSFLFADSNYLAMNARGYSNLYITFSDLNNDSRIDLAYTAQKGATFETKVFFNQASSGLQFSAPVDLLLPIDEQATLCFYPIDMDNLMDVLIGDIDGNLRYYKNTGTPSSPTFSLVTDNYGGLSSINYNCRATICDINNDGTDDLLVANDSGYVKVCNNFLNQTAVHFSYTILHLDPVSRLGQNLSLSTADLTNDGFEELVIGNTCGGLTMFQFDPILSGIGAGQTSNTSQRLVLWPNPAEGYFYFQLPEKGHVQIQDISGALIRESTENDPTIYQSPKLETGFYIITFQGQSGQKYQQKVIVR